MKFVLADGDHAVRAMISSILRQLAVDVELVEATNRTELLACASTHADASLLLVGVAIANACGMLARNELRLTSMPARFVLLAPQVDRMLFERAVRANAAAIIDTTTTVEMLRASLHIVLLGGKYFPPDSMINSLGNERARRDDSFPNLTPRQLEVLRLMAVGGTNKDIARELGMSPGTVKIHVTAILKALNASNRTEAAMSMQRYFSTNSPL